MLSANMIDDKYFETRERSFMYIKKVVQKWSLVAPHILFAANMLIHCFIVYITYKL